MSLNNQEQKCVVCSAYLFEEDDIVYCPVCGAPHHRDCYSHIGHCGLEELHGTDKEYKKPEPESEQKPQPEDTAQNRCRACGTPLESDARFCHSCGLSVSSGAPLPRPPFMVETDIKDDSVIAEGVKASDAAKIVRTNAFRYIPKFLKMKSGSKTSWNWAAFLLPNAWLAYRKMYKESAIVTLLMIAASLLTLPLNIAVIQLPLADNTVANYVELAEYYAGFLSEIGLLPILLSFLSMALLLAIRIVCGMYGDWFYRERVLLAAEKIKESDDPEATAEKLSGTSFIGFFIAVLAIEFIPSFISAFLI